MKKHFLGKSIRGGAVEAIFREGSEKIRVGGGVEGGVKTGRERWQFKEGWTKMLDEG